ncbi:DMT family transporter [Ancylobacter sp. SL191]|uniref:DMT family transporter n=1 Tax=Ancylobacter sp. SL191 TaxID=2995166 RepID=UPI00227182CC|nr:DMT family transporter [Ancylobacter sp. SL191]WAC25685.1 DMT family transporter [Ancylobacter sp. SL191]
MSSVTDAAAARAPSSAVTPGAKPTIPLSGYAFAAGGAILFASKGIIIKLAYAEGVDPETLLALRMLFSLPFYVVIGALALFRMRGQAEPLPSARIVLFSALVGALGYWFASYTDFLGLQYISASYARLILFTYPLFVVLFGALLFKLPVKGKALWAFAVAYSGLALIFAQNFSHLGHDAVLGTGLVALTAMSFALYQVLASRLLKHIGSALFTCIAMIAASAAALGQFAVTHPLEKLIVTPHVFWLSVMLAIGATVLPTFLMNAALSRISAQANAMISTMSPVATMVLAVLILGEPTTALDVFGALLVTFSIGWFTLSDRKSGRGA